MLGGGVHGAVLVMGEPREECVVCCGRRAQCGFLWRIESGRRNLAPSLMTQKEDTEL